MQASPAVLEGAPATAKPKKEKVFFSLPKAKVSAPACRLRHTKEEDRLGVSLLCGCCVLAVVDVDVSGYFVFVFVFGQ